jgi:hypothetical protein
LAAALLLALRHNDENPTLRPEGSTKSLPEPVLEGGEWPALETERQEVSMNWAQFVTIWKQLQMALAGTAAAVALMAGSAVGRADPLEPSLIGAWATSAPDCAKLFVGQGGGLAYRQPVDKFAQALIIGLQQIRSPSSTCRVQSVSHDKGAIKVNAECADSISFQQQSASIKMQPSGEIVYSTTGDPALGTTLIRCRL